MFIYIVCAVLSGAQWLALLNIYAIRGDIIFSTCFAYE